VTAVEIIRCTAPTELYRRYDRQSEAQNAYIELDLRAGSLLADYDAEVGNASPDTVHRGFERRYPIPVLTGEAANRVMEEIAPMAARVLADWEEVWDGHRMVARLGQDAEEAEAEIEEHLGLSGGSGSHWGPRFDDSDLVSQWDADSAVNGCEAQEYGITALTSDERLEEIAADITRHLADIGESKVAVVDGLEDYLRQVREGIAEQSA
jgi:hypothetical protein